MGSPYGARRMAEFAPLMLPVMSGQSGCWRP
ncbi:hypothetical protein MBRU_08780 [Mycolicibacterium brumae DSM 44177]|nr:hypothetical protein MBRU_08780 [Mycolicibacterium brumae DSM 44177]